MSRYFESLKADAVIGQALEAMTALSFDDLKDELVAMTPPGCTIPNVEQSAAMLEQVYSTAGAFALEAIHARSPNSTARPPAGAGAL
jgi:hypothetical protein